MSPAAAFSLGILAGFVIVAALVTAGVLILLSVRAEDEEL